MWNSRHKREMIEPEKALAGRTQTMPVPERNFVNGNPLVPPFPEGLQTIVLGMGCFWGAEEIYWQVPGVYTTAAGYAGGLTPNPTYEETCTGRTGHTEAVQVVYDPEQVGLEELLKIFWERHDPTQGMRQGNDIGTQYRSAIYTTTADQLETALKSRDIYQAELDRLGYDQITTEIKPAGQFFYAEGYHQQYLAKNPNGYRCHSATGVRFPS
ncbi:MAG: peptide-methionine (S)-S-oxide reductase MsrA [Actinomycetota bacterium]